MKRAKKEKTIDTHIYMPLWLLDAVRALAKANRRSVTAEITMALEERIKVSQNGIKTKK